ncbi:hypothetical protein AVEN_218298-1, partial [Araneus ventricosus]
NGTKAMKLTDLALYINALLASCKDPKNFYGENLVRTLRNGVDSAQRDAIFVNPSVYLTLCINNATIHDDTRTLHDLFVSRNAAIGRIVWGTFDLVDFPHPPLLKHSTPYRLSFTFSTVESRKLPYRLSFTFSTVESRKW